MLSQCMLLLYQMWVACQGAGETLLAEMDMHRGPLL